MKHILNAITAKEPRNKPPASEHFNKPQQANLGEVARRTNNACNHWISASFPTKHGPRA